MAKKAKIKRDGFSQSYVIQHTATIAEGKRPKKESSYMKDDFGGAF